MKPGDLRRLNSTVGGYADGIPLHGQPFVVLKVATHPDWGLCAHILVDGKVMGPWGISWVEENSEVISEAR